MDIIKKHKNSIEFILVFVPSAWFIVQIWNGYAYLDQILKFKYSSSLIPSGLDSDGILLISIYGPLILWKIFCRYWIK